MSYDVRLVLSRMENSPEIKQLLESTDSVDLSEAVMNNDVNLEELATKKLMVFPKLVDALKRLVAHFQLRVKARLRISEAGLNFVIRVLEAPSENSSKITYETEDVVEEHDFKSLIEKLKYRCFSNGDFLAMHVRGSIREYQVVEIDNPKYLITVHDLDLAAYDNKDSTVVILPFIIARDPQTRVRLMGEYVSKAGSPRVIFVTVGYDYKDLATKDLLESIEKYFQFFKIDYRESKDILSVDEEYRLRSKIVYSDEVYLIEDLFRSDSAVHRRMFFKSNWKYVQTEMVFVKGEARPEEKGSEVFEVFCDGLEGLQASVQKPKGSTVSVAILGSGCGSLSKYLNSRVQSLDLSCSVTGLEIDEKVMALGTKFFDMNADANCEYIKADAHEFMISSKQQFDAVLIDIDDRTSVPPSQFFSIEFLDAVKGSLANSNFGYLAVNTLGMSQDALDAACEALRVKFQSVKVVSCPNQNNKVLVCEKAIL